MLEVIVERWVNRDKSTDYRWSVWQEGKRVQMGGPLKSVTACEREAAKYCADALGRKPDRLTKL